MEYRGYAVETGSFGMKEIKPTGRGSVVKPLRGMYTTEKTAMRAIDFYEDNKVKGKKDATAESAG